MKIFSKLLAVCCLLTLFSCEGYLDVEQPSIYTDENYYKKPSDFDLAINGCYAQLQKLYDRNWMEAIVSRGDEVRNYKEISRFLDTSLDAKWKAPWYDWWTLIFRCNQILDRIEPIEFTGSTTEEHKKNLKGEAYAMRGLAYLQFAWCWGGAPLVIHEMPREEIYKVRRESQENTYAQAISDFKAAWENLPEKWAEAEAGRVTKYAAAGMLGRTYMYMKNYSDAADWLKEVIDKEGAPYKMATKYEDCFSDAQNNGPERVWEVQYLGGKNGKALGLSQTFSGWFIPSNIAAKNKNDYKLMNNISFVGASNSIRASESLFKVDVYETGDKRKDATIVTGLQLDQSAAVNDQYYVRKFLQTTKVIPSAFDEYGNNIPILRYTDVKLMYAEALNEVDYETNKDQIVSIINEVRTRAGLTGKTTADFADKDAVFDYLVKDRFVEFSFEGIRWPDLIRWNLAEEAMKKHFELPSEGYNLNSNVPLYHMKPYNVLAPIPLSDLLTYGNEDIMWQNDGY